jgi:hypothetical protein
MNMNNRHNYIALIVFLLTVLQVQAQNNLSGKVVDESGEPLAYATVTLLSPVDSTLQAFGVTKDDGVFQIKSIKSNDYILQYSFVGMQTTTDNITIPNPDGEDLGVKVMKANVLDEVEIVAEYIPIQFKSDTVEFNANAFKNKPDAVVEDLLKKIPGIEVDESGNMKALGEDVTKVTVDGKEFFGKDPKVATKNLPAKAVEKVQVYDKKSEEAEFMGIDDGVRDRTINLILNEDHKQGYFGEFKVAGGSDQVEDPQPFYDLDGNLYRFSEKLQSAILGMYNNVNEFGYTGRGHGGWGQRVDGLNNTGAGGLNLSYLASKQNRYFMSYLGRYTQTDRNKTSETEYFQEDGSYFQNSERIVDETDAPHTVNFGVRHNFNKQHKLTVDGDLSFSNNESDNSVLTQTRLLSDVVNDIDNQTINKATDFNLDADAVYIIKFGNGKTQLKTNIEGAIDNNSSEYDLINNSVYYSPYSEVSLSQFQDNKIKRQEIELDPTLVQEIAPSWYLSANVKVNSQNEQLDRIQGDPITEILVDSLGAEFTNKLTTVEPGLSIKKTSAKGQFSINLDLAINTLEKILYGDQIGQNTYYHVLPGFRYENNYKQGRRFTIRYRSNVNMPSASQLLPVSNTINPLSIYRGNPDLEPAYNHNLSLRWSIFDQFSFTAMFAHLGASYSQNSIGISRTTTDNFTQEIVPVNVPYQASVYSFVYFGTPIRPLGIKVNLRLRESYNQGITLVDEEENVNTSLTHSLSGNVENRKKDIWHVSAGGSVSLTNSWFSISTRQNNRYYNTSYFGELNYTPTEQWSIEADGNVVNYNSENFTESFSIPILNAGVTYFFGKANKTSVGLKAYDLLDKNTSIKQITESNYVLQEESNTIGRRIMLEFRMKLGKK